MATNTTTKKPAAAAEESAETVTETAAAPPVPKTPAPAPEVVGSALRPGVEPVSVTLSHHHTIDGTDYPPGAELLVAPDYANHLRAQGYVSRT